MESTIVKEEVTTLILNEEEKNWLKGMVQNHTLSEDETSIKMKQRFWEALGDSSAPDDINDKDGVKISGLNIKENSTWN